VTRLVLILLLVITPQLTSAQSNDLAAKSARANDAMAAGNYKEAVAIYGELARALPDNAGLLMNLGMAQSMAGRPREAIKSLQLAIKLQPSLHPAWLFLGTAFLEAGDAARAVGPLVKAVEIDPGSVRARQMLAEAYLSLERYDEAEAQLRKVTALDQNDATAWYGLGQTHEARARLAFDRLRKAAPESPYESLLVADVLASQKRYEQAIGLYRAALENLPPGRAWHADLAELYERAGQNDAATEERRKAEHVTADCLRRKAECEFDAGRFDNVIAAVRGRKDAESYYWRARAHNELAVEAFARLEQLPPSRASHEFRAQLYRRQGRHGESVKELQQAMKLAPTDRRIREELATSLYLNRDYEAALPLLEDLLKHEPASPELSFLYGDTLLQAQQVEKAIPRLEAAVAGDPAHAEARGALGRAYLQAGQPAKAIPHLAAALETDEDGSLHYQLARAYQATGQPALAKQMLEKYAAIDKARRR
jgi:predicted Zn-dependent protease